MESMLASPLSLFSESVRSFHSLDVVAYIDCDACLEPCGPGRSLLVGVQSDMVS